MKKTNQEFKTSKEGIGVRIRELRKWLRISQTAVGNYLGVPRTAISALEGGKRDLGAQELIKLSRLFRCDPNSLLGLANTPVDYRSEPIAFNARSNSADLSLDDHDLKELHSFKLFLKEKFNDGDLPQRKEPHELVKSQIPQLAAKELRAKLRLDWPVDIYQMIEKIGLYPRFTSLVGLAGAIIRTENTEGQVFGILINSDQPEERTRFSACHEVAHYILEHLQESEPFHPSLKTRWRNPIENDADNFAAELLMPKDAIDAELGKNRNITAVDALKVADTLLVSFQAMVHRLLDLNLISRVQHDEFLECKPMDLRREMTTGRKKAHEFDPKVIKNWISQKSKGVSKEFQESPDWVRFVQEAACFEYWRSTPFNDRASEVKDIYEKTALWLAESEVR